MYITTTTIISLIVSLKNTGKVKLSELVVSKTRNLVYCLIFKVVTVILKEPDIIVIVINRKFMCKVPIIKLQPVFV